MAENRMKIQNCVDAEKHERCRQQSQHTADY